jgi:uncharacterized membrane protein (DUF106 family)
MFKIVICHIIIVEHKSSEIERWAAFITRGIFNMELLLVLVIFSLIVSLYFNFKNHDQIILQKKVKESYQNEVTKLKQEISKAKEDYEKLIDSKKGVNTSKIPMAKHNGGRKRF